MFTGFKLKIENQLDEFYYIGEQSLISNSNKSKSALSNYLNKNSILDGDKMQSDWFPTIDANIFISHSHNDKEKAISLAGWLYKTFNITSFLDYLVWGSADELLRHIDDEYCIHANGSSYSYEKRNYSTSHVHMMLSSALVKMIDKAECVIFLNTPNSINAHDIIEYTESPWIYSELLTTKFINKRNPKRTVELLLEHSISDSKQLKIQRIADTEHLHDLSYSNLQKWKTNYNPDEDKHPLDVLYNLEGIYWNE